MKLTDKNFEDKGHAPISYEYSNDGEVDLVELFSAIWSGRYIVTGVVFGAFLLSLIVSLQLDNEYTANTMLAPASENSSNDMSSVAGQFGGIASLAGLNLDQNQIDKSQLALAVLTSNNFLIEFINKNDIKKDLVAVKEYDANTGELKYDSEYYDEARNSWSEKLFPKGEPTDQGAARALRSIIEYEKIPESGLITVSLTHQSPEIANEWLNMLVADLNQRMKSRDMSEAMRSIEFLENQLELNKLSEVRNVLYSLIEEQTKTLMFADVRDEYAFEIIDISLVPERPSFPNRLLIVGVFTFLFMLFSILFVITRFYYLKHKLNRIDN